MPEPDSVPGFESFLAEVQDLKANERQSPVNRYMATLGDVPVTSGNQAIFLWQGAADSVQITGDMNNWRIEEAQTLTRLDGTDLWTLQAEFEPDARLDYKYVINGGRPQLDPLNPLRVTSSSEPNSVLAMPDYEVPLELLPPENDVPAGTLTSHVLESENLNQRRTFMVYEPAGQLVGRKLPTIYINNGSDFLNLIDTPAILDRLIALRLIPPMVAVFIPPLNPSQDYVFNDAYVNFLADELVPYVQENFDTDPDPAVTGVLGPAEGGLAAVYTAFIRPSVFGLAAGLSGTYSAEDDALIKLVTKQQAGMANLEPIKLYLTVGTYETAVGGDAESGNLLAANRRLTEALTSIRQEYHYEERPQGHSWGLWQDSFGRALSTLFSN